jgi:hypothetical protein
VTGAGLPIPVPIGSRRRWRRPSATRGGDTRVGGRRRFCSGWTGGSRSWTCPPRAQLATSWRGAGWSPSGADGGPTRTRAWYRRLRRSRTICGRPTSRGTSEPRMGSTATRSRWPTSTPATCSPSRFVVDPGGGSAAHLRRLFRTYGLPGPFGRITAPFATTGIHGLSSSTCGG